jgi:hypothetical protein
MGSDEGGRTPEPEATPEGAPEASPVDAPPATPPPDPPVPPVAWNQSPPAAVSVPPVAWAPPPAAVTMTGVGDYSGGRPPFTVGALLRDTFARYSADPWRLIALAGIPALLSFAVSFGLRPGTEPRSTVGLASLLGLLGFIVGIVFGASTFALLEGGPTLSFSNALRRGFARSGWFVLTFLLLFGLFILAVILSAIVVAIVAVLAALSRSPVVFVLIYVAFLVAVFWFWIRVSLAIPAVVVDNVGPIDAVKVAWRATRPLGVWLRILAAGFLLGLLFLPVAFGALALELPAMLGQGAPFGLASLVIAAALAPVGSTFIYSAYRRLVPPFWPPWARMPSPVLGPDGRETIPPPSFEVPPFGTGARVIVTGLVVLAILGVAVVGVVLGQFLSGALSLHFVPGQPIYPGGPTFPPFPTFAPFPTFEP